MIAKLLDDVQEPVVLHEDLKTTFTGVVHPVSTPDAPVHQYLGIKYASIPARFRQSRLYTHYPPQTDCSHHGPICPQPQYKSIEEELFNLTEDCIPNQALKQSEFDCLNLSITCPASATPDSQFPVMLWIHGGGNRGSGANWVCDAGPLVQKSIQCGKPVVIVSINFRLGLLGFAASPALREDNKAAGDEGVGNYGLWDQRRAMEWIYRFIQPFGGNPNNVTVFGESTGAGDILCHLHSAANEVAPLFQRAIIQSAIVDMEVPNVHQAGWQLGKLMCALRVQSIEELRQVDAERLVMFGSHARATDDGFFFRKSWTGSLVPVDDAAPSVHHSEGLLGDNLVVELNGHSHHLKVPHTVRSKPRSRSRSRHPQSSHQPVLIGDCGAESLLWSLPASLWTSAGAVKRIRAICQSLNKSNVLLRLYDIGVYTPADELPERILDLINDARFAWPTQKVADSLRSERGGHGVWRYVFDQEGPSRGVPHHAVDLMYLFDNVPLPALPCASAYDDELRSDGGYYSDSDDEECIAVRSRPSSEGEDGCACTYECDADWAMPVVDDWTYSRVRNAIQERWLAFAYGEAPWREDRVFVFGPEGETGERSMSIFNARRRTQVWKEALEPLGVSVVQKLGVELCNGPPADGRSTMF
ncbi:carboxylesterase [Lentinus tigrinus ALCF2SS1-7]|uniref:Carboxylic ester hydrolase n=1 Tax=Lentinus tigrinus ALCF2SS1-6 TaxID=1328759 RepID=A0A5C2S0N3_9APHY|nr:carboxylesterase [Lentinus tigrinus ALCF2SS1-6]RPD71797.1 carboxylesterase [Lentinus tigrinus ALCF2SS1-7]